MVTYNPKDWFTLIIQFHKSDTFRRLFWSLVSIGVYSAVIVYSEAHFFHLETKNPTVMHSILGFVLSMLLVFRTNSAYDRWWEGRKIWGRFGDLTDGLEATRIRLWKKEWSKLDKLAYPDKWEDEILGIWLKRAKEKQ